MREGLPLTELERIAIEEGQLLGLSQDDATLATREGMRAAMQESGMHDVNSGEYH